jgi:hypothetical protein
MLSNFNINNCSFIVFGYRDSTATHRHIHNGILRALEGTYGGRCIGWLDPGEQDRIPPNTLVISNWEPANELPVRDDLFYVIHGMNDHLETKERFWDRGLSWNVFVANSHSQAIGGAGPIPGAVKDPDAGYFLDKDIPFWPQERRLDFRWPTDLLPWEVRANKPDHILGRDSSIIHYVGTRWRINEKELDAFAEGVRSAGFRFQLHGGVSMKDHIRLIQESRIAPAILGSHHLTEGYLSCRLSKNVSYGHLGVTNSQACQDIFEGRLILDTNPRTLYQTAEEAIQHKTLKDLHEQMEFVATNHTYVNRLDAVFKAIRALI